MSGFTRRTFMISMGAGSAAAALSAACHNKAQVAADAAVDAASCSVNDAMTTIVDNHAHAPHVLVVTPSDVDALADKPYSIQGAANHDHTVTVTADQFAALKAGGSNGSVMDTSTIATIAGNDHSHVCVIVCA
jgi:hypothetical protein